MQSLNSSEIHEANSKAISLCANTPPYFPILNTIPIAFVVSIHFFGDNEKELYPALSYLNIPINQETQSYPFFSSNS